MASLLARTFEEILRTPPPSVTAGVSALVDMAAFWMAAGPERYFATSKEFDDQLVSRYSTVYPLVHEEKIIPSEPDPTHEDLIAQQHLGMVLLLDQYPRNAFRGSPKQYQSDTLARKWANIAIERGLDAKVDSSLTHFFYLPFGHSESLADQDRAVQLGEKIAGPFLSAAKQHREVIKRFGRFCHRNDVMGRPTTDEEKHWLEHDAPGWAKS